MPLRIHKAATAPLPARRPTEPELLRPRPHRHARPQVRPKDGAERTGVGREEAHLRCSTLWLACSGSLRVWPFLPPRFPRTTIRRPPPLTQREVVSPTLPCLRCPQYPRLLIASTRRRCSSLPTGLRTCRGVLLSSRASGQIECRKCRRCRIGQILRLTPSRQVRPRCRRRLQPTLPSGRRRRIRDRSAYRRGPNLAIPETAFSPPRRPSHLRTTPQAVCRGGLFRRGDGPRKPVRF